MDLITHQPENGPQIVVLHDESAFTASFGWFVRTGARHEAPELAGVSHFLEHMVFKGTPRRTAEDVNRELDHLGAQSNAFTSEDATVFYASVLPECQQQAVDLLSDLMQPTLAENEFEMEKQVILEEIAMYDDQPPYGAFEKACELFMGDHPLATRVLGSAETVSDLTASQMRDYHQQRYALDNMCFAASGNIEVAQLIDQVQELTEKWPRRASRIADERPRFQSASEIIEREVAHQDYLIRVWPGLSANDADRYALRMLCSILADDSGSRLFWELIDTGRAETASIWPQMFEDCGCVFAYLCSAPEDAQANEETMTKIIQQVIQDGVTEKELDLARHKIESSLVLSDERPGNRLFAAGQSWLSRRTYEPLDVVLARYRDIDIADVQRVAASTLSGVCSSVRVVGDAD